MDFIYLKKEGLFTKSKKKFIVIDKSISYYLNAFPKIDNDFTVEDLMNILKKHETEVDFLFQSFTKGYNLHLYYEEMNLESLNDNKSKISKLEFSWVGEVENIKEFGKPKFEISQYAQVNGKVEFEKDSYSLSFVNLNEIKDAKFKINKKIIYQYIEFGNLWDENRKVTKKTFFNGVKEFTFQDIIGYFLNEITFYGYPEDADDEADKLDKIILNIDKSKTTPFEEIQLKWKKKLFDNIDKKKKTEKNLLRLEKLKKEIDYLENSLKNKN
ncbi:hypothetical protein [Flavobacterium sp.]|uniref:hypothetical protein n=1 Tax=Flavobacterium sp. TaxID=239 RepID=UPI003750D3E8